MTLDLELFQYWRSSCSWRVRWALFHKEIDFKSTPVNLLKREHKDPGYLAKNPAGTVPCLLVNGRPLSESMAILEWLEETFPTRPLLPNDGFSRQRVRQLCQTIVSGIQPLQNLEVLTHVSEAGMDRAEFARFYIRKGLETYEKLVVKFGLAGTYSMGSQLTLADLCLIPQCYNARRFNIDPNEFPNISRIEAHCLKLDSCKKAIPEKQPGAS